MIMKKCLITLSTIALTIIMAVLLVACSHDNINQISTVIGDKRPDLAVKNKITSSMSALEMYEAGIKNYADAAYVGGIQTGTIAVRAVGLDTQQSMFCKRVKDVTRGAAITNYAWTNSGLVDIRFMDEAIADNNGYRKRSADKIGVKDGQLVATKWKATENFNNLDDLLVANPNNPYLANMFTVNFDTLESMTEPVYDKKTKQYSFSLTLKPVEGTIAYVAMVKKTLEAQGFSNPNVNFTALTLDVVMWDNGLIRSIASSEEYSLNGKMGILNIKGTSVQSSFTNYTYDKTELLFDSVADFN